ncbi:hypothetical protein GPECTOR_138g657 [Gonium pectorale]|uniref:Apple domain-containing protein n=1 Tax=Gonium pectorale TaxID=33097 RepID=A0A150FY45_GONPE|nr:hypothetical protein GPECTOR_138g657 [Gonium pectorale]|eukprot:KXZ42526.1 hypothetical protein GPECTOR_138g657 [Gonium pectorale]
MQKTVRRKSRVCCEYSIFSTFDDCFLKKSPFNGTNGVNAINSYFAQVCLKRRARIANEVQPLSPVRQSADPGCMAGVDIQGFDKKVLYATSREECRLACDNDLGCRFSVRNIDGNCYIKTEPFGNKDGKNSLNGYVDQLCLKRGTDMGCFSGVSWQGNSLYSFNTTSKEACRAECDGNVK